MDAIISTWTGLLQQFFPIFTSPGARIFSQLMIGWVLCTARRTITGMLPFAEPLGLRAHDAYHRFLPDGQWSMNQLWQLLTLILARVLCPIGILTLALDDTLFHHSGRKINGAGYWRDAVRSTRKSIVYAWGLNLVVLNLQIQPHWGGEPLGLPINMRLHRKNGPTLIELAVQMINEVSQECECSLHISPSEPMILNSYSRSDVTHVAGDINKDRRVNFLDLCIVAEQWMKNN